MAVTTILTIILVLVVVALVFTLVKKLIKWFFVINILLVIIIAIFGYMVYSDVQDLKENFASSENLFLLQIDNQNIAGISAPSSEEREPKFLSANDLSKDYTDLADTYYKIFIMKPEAFAFVEEVEFDDDILPASLIFQMLESDDAIGTYAQKKSEGVPGSDHGLIKQTITGQDIDNTQFKNMLFANLLSAATKQKGLAFILEGLKDNTANIYPETIIFKVLKKSPPFLTNRLGNIIGTG